MTTADMGPRPGELDDIARGERFYQQLLNEESRAVPASLRATSVGYTEPVDIAHLGILLLEFF